MLYVDGLICAAYRILQHCWSKLAHVLARRDNSQNISSIILINILE